MVQNTSLCGLGQSAPNPIISTLHYFRQEYTDLIEGLDDEGVPAVPKTEVQS